MVDSKRSSKNDDYSIGLDIGTGSVGWSVQNDNYRLMRAKGHELIGVRLFDPAHDASARRNHRSMRRRLSRRRWRLGLLDSLFAKEINAIDPNFFQRRKYSWVHPKDKENQSHYFGSLIFPTEKENHDFLKKYPTVYHLRKALMEDEQKHDIREIFVAIHHILKFRGNFLTQGEIDTSNVFRGEDLVQLINNILVSTLNCDDKDIIQVSDVKTFESILIDTSHNKTWRKEEAQKLIINGDSSNYKKIIKAILSSVLGNQTDLIKIFNLSNVLKEEEKELKFSFSDAEIDTKLIEIEDMGRLDDEQYSLLLCLWSNYNALTLKSILGEYTSISESKVQSYNDHHAAWEQIKKLRTRENRDEINKYYGYLCGWELGPTGERQAISKATGDKNTRKTKEKHNKEAYSYFKKLIESSGLSDDLKKQYVVKIENHALFPLQRGTEAMNSVIPNQLHVNELRAILQKQGRYYPFLLNTYEIEGKEENKIVGLLRFRVPYFVGPLVEPEIRNSSTDNMENHWMIRKPNHAEVITPWNMPEVVDYDKSGEEFIARLKGTDTYLLGEPTLPKHSLLYQEFEVLNELSNVRLEVRSSNHWSNKNRQRLSPDQKRLLFGLFKKTKTVTVKRAEECLNSTGDGKFTIYGLSDEKKFTSSLDSYLQLRKILGSEFVDNRKNYCILEQIVECQTVFEDKKTLRHQLDMIDGLSETARKNLSQTHYTGWGRLSRKLLTSQSAHFKLSTDFAATSHSIITILRNASVNLMELINDKTTGIPDWINEQNAERKVDTDNLRSLVDDVPTSPRVKRGIIQSINVVDDITRALGKKPKRIFLEMAGEVQESKKSVSRKDKLKDLYENASLEKEFSNIKKDFEKETKEKLQDDRLYLYYIQLGKDMYTGKPIDIKKIQSHYDIDHIIPQSATKNDSIDNRVLVSRIENARKTDSFHYTSELINRMGPYWLELNKKGFISDRKYAALTRTDDYSKREKERFVARSLVETRQIIKNVSTVLRQYYGKDVEIIGLNSDLTEQMRRYLGFSFKDRDINDYHHAQDALCIASAGIFSERRGFFSSGKVTESSLTNAVNAYNIYQNEYLHQYRQEKSFLLNKKNSEGLTPEEEYRLRMRSPFGFVIGSMRSKNDECRTNKETGEIVWDETDADYLCRVMNFKKMLVTKKTGTISGPLYDEMRYGHKNPKGFHGIPLDRRKKKVALYGGFSGVKTAYCILVERQNKVQLLNVTTAEASALSRDKSGYDIFLKRHQINDARILISEIPVGQLIKHDSSWMTIQSASEMNNAQQLWLPSNIYRAVHIILQSETCEEAVNQLRLYQNNVDICQLTEMILDEILQRINKFYKDDFHMLSEDKIEKAKQKFSSVGDYSTRRKIIKGLIAALHANATRADLSAIGLSTRYGRLTKKSGYKLADSDIFVFQSPTGIFEQRITVGDLRRRAQK